MASTATGTAAAAAYRDDYATPPAGRTYAPGDGFDLIWDQTPLQTQMSQIEASARLIMADANLTDTERMFEMQMSMNAWSAIASLRTNYMKCVSDSVKMICRNIV